MTAAGASERLDQALLARALAPSRQRAQAMIAAGLVEVDGRTAGRAAARVTPATVLRIVGPDHPWAGRGGLKLDAALEEFGIACDGRVCLDAGASTGGFTDVLVSRGAGLVYAVDVGRGQLAPRLAALPQVIVLDRTNLRTLRSLPGPSPDLVTLDLAFISLRAVLPTVAGLIGAARTADVIALFKPQFELGRGAVPRGGVVRDQSAAEAAIAAFLDWCDGELGATQARPPLRSPVLGAKGNQEWLLHLSLPGRGVPRGTDEP